MPLPMIWELGRDDMVKDPPISMRTLLHKGLQEPNETTKVSITHFLSQHESNSTERSSKRTKKLEQMGAELAFMRGFCFTCDYISFSSLSLSLLNTR